MLRAGSAAHRRLQPGDTQHPVCGRLTIAPERNAEKPLRQRLDVYNGLTEIKYQDTDLRVCSLVSRNYDVLVVTIDGLNKDQGIFLPTRDFDERWRIESGSGRIQRVAKGKAD